MEPETPDPAPSASPSLGARFGVVLAAGASGAALGWVLATRLPVVEFGWTGFVLAPFFLLLERTLPPFVRLFNGDRNTARLSLAGALVAGFYAAWFGARTR